MGDEQREPDEEYREKPVKQADERSVLKKERWTRPKERSRGQKRFGYAVAIIVNLILLYVANNLLAWRVPFITSDFVVPLRYLNISLIATAVANLLFFFYDPDWFLGFTRIGLNIVGIIVSLSLYVTFPFDLSSLASEGILTLLVRFALILGIVGSTIGVIAEFVKFIKAISEATLD